MLILKERKLHETKKSILTTTWNDSIKLRKYVEWPIRLVIVENNSNDTSIGVNMQNEMKSWMICHILPSSTKLFTIRICKDRCWGKLRDQKMLTHLVRWVWHMNDLHLIYFDWWNYFDCKEYRKNETINNEDWNGVPHNYIPTKTRIFQWILFCNKMQRLLRFCVSHKNLFFSSNLMSDDASIWFIG